MKRPSVTVYGGINIDLIIHCSKTPGLGQSVKGHSYNQYPGGKGANQAAAAARLGGNVTLLGSVGADMFGDSLMDTLKVNNIDVSNIIRLQDFPTGTAFIVVDDTGQNMITFVGGANDGITCSDIDKAGQVIKDADILLLQSECPEIIVEYVINKAESLGTSIIFNPSPVEKNTDKLIEKCEVLLPNEHELEELTGMKVVDEKIAMKASEAVTRGKCSTVITTMGSKGAFVYRAGGFCGLVPARKVRAIDTVGAGDVFAGAFSVRYGLGENIEKAVMFANTAASISTTRKGAQTSIPGYEEVMMETN